MDPKKITILAPPPPAENNEMDMDNWIHCFASELEWAPPLSRSPPSLRNNGFEMDSGSIIFSFRNPSIGAMENGPKENNNNGAAPPTPPLRKIMKWIGNWIHYFAPENNNDGAPPLCG